MGLVRRLSGSWSHQRLSLVIVALLVCAPTGCTRLAVRRADGYGILDSFQASVSTGNALSPRTLQTLRQLDLEAVYYSQPTDCFRRLQEESEKDAQTDVLFALAELSYQLGQRTESRGAADACAFYYLCAGYAFHYLFDRFPLAGPESLSLAESAVTRSHRGEEANPFDPRYRLACDLYNAALAQCIRTAQRAGRLDPRQQLHLATPDGQGFTLIVQHEGFAWGPEEFGPLLVCADYDVVGLANQHRRYGLGVPLIGTRTGGRPTARHAFYPDAVSFPVSAFFRFEGSLADLHRARAGVLELYNPLEVSRLTVRGRSVPLESDLTTPLAYFLAHTDLQEADFRGFLKPDTVEARAGIYMFEPYQPGKIPVVMVHGLLSSPLTWAPLFNELRADPQLRERFQFWFYLYPTGPGYLQAAADLRADLAQLRAELDPAGQDQALREMVLVGHSMGGLVSRLLTVDSHEDFWQVVSHMPLGQLAVDAPAKAELARLFYFQRVPEVKRVIFITTPHRGSNLSITTPGLLAAKLVQLPHDMLKTGQELMKTRDDLLHGPLPTSIDMLSPNSPALHLLASRPRPPDVPFHSIIGRALPHTLLREITRPFLGNEPTDGAVPYASAHLDDAESELIVPADHMTVHHHPLAVREVRRILLEHLAAVRARPVTALGQ